ncbi:type II toxin-antitoxin system HicA family toxin [Bacillus sp. NPDC094106]|uniref:type II toxin-antitoxin system HicA family toxin n=1 Tax=Bacillus sp. NPDC094106 TaxID=3363949 RepID=UPI00382940FC
MPSSRDAIKVIKKDGWFLKDIRGDHHQFIHPTKKGKVTIQHPVKDLPKWIYHSILKQAGLK